MVTTRSILLLADWKGYLCARSLTITTHDPIERAILRDRQVFEEQQLPNGIRTYSYQDTSPVTFVSITIPVGSAHNRGNILPGTFHFLEHMVFKRSQLYPGLNDFWRKVGLKGATINATTKRNLTVYTLEVPSVHLDEVVAGFISLIFDPLLSAEDVTNELA